jgi:hypothetical protein
MTSFTSLLNLNIPVHEVVNITEMIYNMYGMSLSARSINDSNFTPILYINRENKTTPLKEFF